MMSGKEQMNLLYQLIPQIQKLDTTRVILHKDVNFTEEELAKVEDLIALIHNKAEKLMQEAKTDA